MHKLTRRDVLMIGASATAILAGCTTTQATTTQALITDAQAIATGLYGALSTYLTPAQLAQASKDLTTLNAAANAVSNAVSNAAAQPSVQTIISTVNDIVAFLPTVLSASSLASIDPYVAAAQFLLPIIAGYVGIASAPSRKFAASMTEKVAVQKLLSVSKK